MRDLSTRLSSGPVLLDGGLGQELIRRGMPGTEPSLWSANALDEAPDLVQEVHEAYLRAGADIVGGCCEVGPGHIAHLRTMVNGAADARRAAE